MTSKINRIESGNLRKKRVLSKEYRRNSKKPYKPLTEKEITMIR